MASSRDSRVNVRILTAVLADAGERRAVSAAVRSAHGTWGRALKSLEATLPVDSLQRVSLAHDLAGIAYDHLPLVKKLVDDPNVSNLRDLALNCGIDHLADMVDPKKLPANIQGETEADRKRNFAVALRRNLYNVEPTAVLQRMVSEAELPIPDAAVRSGIVSFLNNLPDFDVRTTSVYQAFREPEAFNGVGLDIRPSVAERLKTIQRVQAISPVPEAVPHLMEANLTSAFSVAQLPESTFLDTQVPHLGEDTARQVYTNAISAHIRNEGALMHMLDTVRGSGLAVIDGPAPLEKRVSNLQAVADSNGVPLNLSDLFGGIDYCECDDCQSVYSPTAYFVELLQFLRNNNLQKGKEKAGIDGTPLEKLLRRRPDLGCLELTCENAFTVLPYIDLVNEVMEGFVVHAGDYHSDTHDPKQSTLDVFNVDGEATSELLAQPQHVNFQAYCTLKSAVYPFTLPYHQPIDTSRIWLKALETSRYEVLDTFRTPTESCDNVTLTPEQLEELRRLHALVIDRAVDAEYLGITQEEYIILTRQAFWPKSYFDLTTQTEHTQTEYEQKIGVRPVHEYYGYGSETLMLDTDEVAQAGLTFVKKQFLPRTGVHYTDLVDLVKTRYINPAYPTGGARKLMEAVRFSYRFLQTLVDTSSTDPAVRFAKLIGFLNTQQPITVTADALLHPDPCREKSQGSVPVADFTNWVHCYFDRIGQLIVLNSGEEPRLPIAGDLFKSWDAVESVGYLHSDGTILDKDGTLIGTVTVDGFAVSTEDGRPFPEQFGVPYFLDVRDDAGKVVGFMAREDGHLISTQGGRHNVAWLPVSDTCDLDRVRLTHLDGSALTAPEYDRIQRFLRLWRKMAWTVQETDAALIGLSDKPGGGGGADRDADCDFVGFESFQDDCVASWDGPGGESNCPDIPPRPADISVDVLHQLVAVRKALKMTGLPLDKLLTFWADISTAGDRSLYSRLFLTHNLSGIDKVFKSDHNGNVLTTGTTIAEHMPVLMAALRLTAEEIQSVLSLRKLPGALTLHAVSVLYRHALLAKLLHVKVADLAAVVAMFGDPFANAESTRKLLRNWQHMEDAGFTFQQLDYIIRDHDDPRRPLAPTQRAILQNAKSLYEGLTAIDREHPDLPADASSSVTDDLVRGKSGLIFEQSTVEQIIGLLDGTTVHTTNAPAGLSLTIPESLDKVLKYANQASSTPPSATVQVTGILTDDALTLAKSLSADPNWARAIDRAGKQPRRFFKDTLAGLFPDSAEALRTLLAGDVNPTPKPEQPGGVVTETPTAPTKRRYFLRRLLPYLRARLAHRFIADLMATASGLNYDLTDVLLSNVLLVGSPPRPALEALESIKQQPATGTTGWKGYLLPPAADAYVLVAVHSDTQPAPLLLGDLTISFPHQQEDPSNVWWTDPVTLKPGTLQWLDTKGLSITQLQWKTATSPPVPIPAAALLPDLSAKTTAEAFAKLTKAALLSNGFALSAEEATYLQTNKSDFDGFDFNAFTLQHWRRLRDYCALRDTLPKVGTTLLELFGWASQPPEANDASAVGDRVVAVTLWDSDQLASLLSEEHFDLDRRAAFRNEIGLVKLEKALSVATRTRASIDRLFAWANPTTAFWACHDTATEIQATLRARYDQSDWEQVVRPLYDQLRENQRSALIAHLLVDQDLIDWGVVDADSLFEFFLIDVQMSVCLDTSRIKQAISTVQSFVQRCLLGLEADRGVGRDVLDRQRWDWMQKYRVWEANRKVFLYPENWLRAELRDDKSEFFRQLESELLQKDIEPRTVADALRAYVVKVDQVANLQVAGIFLDTQPGASPANPKKTLHIFARTRNAPHVFYYRHYAVNEQNWYPWVKVDTDIPSYDVEAPAPNGGTVVTENGSYAIPVVWQNRPLVFAPQFLRKTAPRPIASGVSFKTVGEGDANAQQSFVYWEIKMGWSEYRDGKWTQRQLATKPVYETTPTSVLPDISSYEFVPRLVSGDGVFIDVYQDAAAFGAFKFTGSQLFAVAPHVTTRDVPNANFHYVQTQIHSMQGVNSDKPLFAEKRPFFDVEPSQVTFKGGELDVAEPDVAAYHRFAHELLGTLNGESLDPLFDYYLNNLPTELDKSDAYGRYTTNDGVSLYHELKAPYALYNWEAVFHTPMLLADRLLTARQFDATLEMLHHILNPFAKGTAADPIWRFTPFGEINPADDLEQLFRSLKPNTPNDQVSAWRDHPFQPHVVARDRPAAYMKWVAMKYIQTWIDYGDYYFRQNTLESLPLAIQCYVVAAHVYGPPGELIPKRGHKLPQTYNSLLEKWDAFSNAMVELELAFPFSNQTPFPSGSSNGVVGLANVFGFATSLYFCIPDNPQLRALRSLIDDRLFKIRHCQDIDGVTRHLPLFEPPIDPALLVQAAAQGLSISSVLNDLNSPMPNYRFTYQLQKAFELCAELKALGGAFLSAKEKGDAEALAKLRATHESSIHELVMTVRTQQLDEATSALEALQQSRKAPVYRLQHQLKLIGEDLAKVPEAETDFSEIPDQIEQPIDDSGLKLISFEKEEMDKAADAQARQTAIGVVESLASVFHAIPSLGVYATPFGVGGTGVWGGSNLGSATQAVARYMQMLASGVSFESTSAGRKAGFQRQLQDRVQQANVAGYEIKNIDRQILSQNIRIAVAQQEITNQQKQIDNAQEVQDLLTSKYSNSELYSWMDSEIRGLHYQAYTMAYDLAKKAEKLFRFERGLDNSDFIQFGYWDAGHDGLLAGERLYHGLKQLELAYQEKCGHDFEIPKWVSVRQLDPIALVTLRETGSCEIAIPEVLFDMDYAGHYQRRLKTVALRIPAVLGPYTSLNCTLRLLEHEYRNSAMVPTANDYPQKTDEDDDRFTTVNVPITSIAVSSSDTDAGVFELNFHDERYLPFEGAGAISKWRIELPAQFRQFDYDTITDVQIGLRYTSMDGGDKLKSPAADSVQKYIRSVEDLSRDQGLFAAFDVVNDFPDEWYTANHPVAGATERVLTLNRLNDKLPIFTKGRLPAKIQATDLVLYVSSPGLAAASLSAVQGGNQISFSDGPAVGNMKCFVAHDVASAMDNLQLTIADTTPPIDKFWLLERYTLL